VALYRNYHAPFDVYISLNERLVERSNANMLPANLNVCVGKEWYRYPSSFFMPSRHTLNNSCTVHYRFIRSEFRGLLPSYYDSRLPFPMITRAVPQTQNDANREEMDRYLDVNECDYLFDLETSRTTPLEPNYAQQTNVWTVVKSEKFLIAEQSDRFYRAFFIPYKSAQYVTYGNYVLLERIVSSSTKTQKKSHSDSSR